MGATLLFAVPPQKSLTKYNSKVSLSSFRSSSLPTMSDDEGDVHVCDICQEIFLGTDELEQRMKEDHADKEENGGAEKGSKRSRSSSGDSGSKEERRREEKKMKKHK